MTTSSFDNNAHPVTQAVHACLEAAHARNATLHAFLHLADDAALARAAALDTLDPALRGPLHGVPLAVKETFDVAGMPCPWGAELHRGRVPDATAALVARLEAAGAVVVGITHSTEYAIAAAPPTVHPDDPGRSPGASSSGSAAAVGAALVPLALGSQTIGSVIRPAAYCGAVGFKPSFGRYPLAGMMPLSLVLDHPGLIADRVERVAAVDALFPGALDAGPAQGLCWIPPWFPEPVDAPVAACLQRAWARLATLDLPRREQTVPAAVADLEERVTQQILTHDIAALHGVRLRAGADKVSAALMALVQAGEAVSAEAYQAALAQQDEIARQLQALLAPGEIGVTCATVGIAPPRVEGSGSRAPQRLWTLAGMPTLTLPVGRVNGLPVGMQLIARRGEDRGLLALAAQIEALGAIGDA